LYNYSEFYMSLLITKAMAAPDTEFDSCYRLMQATFPADELVDRAEYEYLLQRPRSLQHPHWFAMLARWDEAASQLVGMVVGSYMALDGESNSGIGMIEYLAVAPNYQHGQGHGKALLDAFERLMQRYAQQRGETLRWVVGEVEDDLLAFKFHLGYRLPAHLRYLQPPIEFDAEGNPCYAPVAKHLVMKAIDRTTRTIAPDVLRAVIQTIYRWRYIPLLGDEITRMHAADFIQRHVYANVSESIVSDGPIGLSTTRCKLVIIANCISDRSQT
jgi:ribosomal protein S18 acetylase RimI-like enzyme